MRVMLEGFWKWFNTTFPGKFKFRYDKITKAFFTISIPDIATWDKDYASRLSAAGMLP